MASRNDPIPSATQLLALADRVPSEKPPAPPVARILHHLVDVCRTKWIRDFLFTTDPIHVPHFSSPTFTNNAFACHHSSTHVEPPSPQPAATRFGESRHHEGTLLFVPAFTAGLVTVGFGVMESRLTMGAPWQLEGRMSKSIRLNFRFVRDASREALVTMFSVPEKDYILMRYFGLESTTCCHKFEVQLRRKQLLGSIDGPDAHLSIEKLLAALQMFHDEYQYRPCFVCRSPPAEYCGCFLPINQPAHPFDAKFIRAGMSHLLGSFQSIASRVFVIPGQQQRHVVLGARSSYSGISDPALIRSLQEWTLAEHAKNMQENPRQSSLLERTHASNSGKAFDRAKGTDDVDFGAVAIDSITDAHAAIRNVELSTTTFLPSRPDAFTTSGANSGAVGASFWANPSSIADPLHVRGDIEMVMEQQGKDNGRQETPVPDSVGRTWQGSASQGDASMHCAEPSTRNDDSAEEALTAEKLRTRLRKERNRASARRCNQRNKAKREGLKLELTECHEKVVELRTRELMLRKENISLRAALQGETTGMLLSASKAENLPKRI